MYPGTWAPYHVPCDCGTEAATVFVIRYYYYDNAKRRTNSYTP